MRKKINKILLISPPFYRFFGLSKSFLPIGLLSIGTVLKQNGFNVKVYNSDFERGLLTFDHPFTEELMSKYNEYRIKLFDHEFYVWREIEEKIKEESPDIVGIGFTTDKFTAACRVAEIVKNINKDILVIAGGPHPTSLPEETIEQPNFDILVRGEGELSILSLLKNIEQGNDLSETKGITFRKNGQIVSTPPMHLIKNLDEIPIYDREILMDYKEYSPAAMGNLVTSRGCPYNCSFCSAHICWGRTARFRNIIEVIKEIELIHKKYGTVEFSILDDAFTLDKNRISYFCKELQRRKLKIFWTCITRADLLTNELLREMKGSGCRYVSIGIESGEPEILKKTGKEINLAQVEAAVNGIKKLKINAHAYFMVGFLEETEESLKKTEELMKRLRLDYISIAFVVPYPGTQIYNELIKKDKLLTREWLDFFPENPDIFKRDFLSNEALNRAYLKLKKYTSIIKAASLKKESRSFIYLYKKIEEGFHSPAYLLENIKKFFRLQFSRNL